MKINGIDIRKYDAKQLTADVQPPSFANSYEWLTGAALPTEFETEVQMGHLKLSIYFKGKDRNNIIRAAPVNHSYELAKEGGCTSAVNCFASYFLMSIPFIFIALFYLPFRLFVTISASTFDTVLLAISSPSMYV